MPVRDAPTAPSATPSPLLRMRGVDLEPKWVFAPTKHVPAAKRTPGTSARQVESTLARRVTRWIGRSVGRANVRQGNVDPFFYELGKRLGAHFRPNEKMLPRRRRKLTERLNSYLAKASRFGRSPAASIASRRNTRERIEAELMAKQPDASRNIATGVKTRGATVCVVVGQKGSRRVRVVRTSHLPRLDAAARRALRQALAAGRAPNALHGVRACYRLSVIYGRDFRPPAADPLGTITQLLSKKGDRVCYGKVELEELTYPPGTKRWQRARQRPAPAEGR